MIKTLIKSNTPGTFVRNHWLILLIILQPILDIVAFWTKNPDGTIAGLVRLAVMVILPLVILIRMNSRVERLRFVAAMAAIALVCALHIANTLRVGAVDLMFDISYTAKTAQLPILAVCFMFSIKNC